MISDLDDTLAQFLRSTLPASIADQVQVTFAAPDSQFPPQSVTLPAIDMFLYDVRENTKLRSNELHTQRQGDGTAVIRQAPRRVDFSYLVTAWPSTTVNDPWRDEHRLLGEVMRSLLRFSTLPADVLRGELATQDPMLPISSLEPGHLDNLGVFWQAIGRPKAALNYTVTVSVETTPRQEPLVMDKRIDFFALRRGTADDGAREETP